ncbi:hypothetical protein F4604DRAFT_273424 [Suillus subluteus]|nr:hypothetical protein F4604DRAFT_273424 [Suillus subluteus]
MHICHGPARRKCEIVNRDAGPKRGQGGLKLDVCIRTWVANFPGVTMSTAGGFCSALNYGANDTVCIEFQVADHSSSVSTDFTVKSPNALFMHERGLSASTVPSYWFLSRSFIELTISANIPNAPIRTRIRSISSDPSSNPSNRRPSRSNSYLIMHVHQSCETFPLHHVHAFKPSTYACMQAIDLRKVGERRNAAFMLHLQTRTDRLVWD